MNSSQLRHLFSGPRGHHHVFPFYDGRCDHHHFFPFYGDRRDYYCADRENQHDYLTLSLVACSYLPALVE